MSMHPSEAPTSGAVATETFPTQAEPRLSRLARLVVGVQQDLGRRIAREEGPGGLFAHVGSAAPRYRPLLENIRADHRRLGAALDAMLLRLHGSEDARWDALVVEVATLTAAIRENESLKDEILRDVCDCAE
jgi:hypothetical protein